MYFKNKLFCFLLINLIFYSSYVRADSNIQEDEAVEINYDVLNYLKRNISISTIYFSDSIKSCEQQRNKIFMLDTEYLKSISATRKDVIIGLIYWDYQNVFKCRHSAQLKFSYDLGMLVSIQRYYKLDYQKTLDIAANLLYPAVDNELEHVVAYSKLSIKLRDYLEKKIGDKPFNLVKSMGSIELPRQ